MFRLWAKLWKDNRMQRDTVIANGDYSMSRTAMVFDAMEKVCYEFDLGQPIWLEANICLLYTSQQFFADRRTREYSLVLWKVV